jgi:hypothetical protein
MMHKTMLTPAEIRRLSELSSQYELTEEYIAMLAAHLAGENMLSVGILVKRAMTLVGQGVTDNIIATMSGHTAGSKAFHRYHNSMKNKQQNVAVTLLD